MEQNIFIQYQRELSRNREKFLKEKQKLSPKVLLNDEDFDASIGDIPMNIKPPVPPVLPKPVQKETHKKQDSNPLW